MSNGCREQRLPRLFFPVLFLALFAGEAVAHASGGLFDLPPTEIGRRFEPRDVLKGWDAFTDVWFIADMAIIFMLSALLGAITAYHPLVRSKASSIPELEQPKTFIMYSLVGALTGMMVQVNLWMGPVVFGIGGLLRFRTNVGPAKDTGRVILAVLVGIACGLKLLVAAVFATAFGWVLTWYLESQEFGRLQVQGLARDAIPRATEAYRRILTGAGCKILGEKKKITKGTVTFVFSAPRQLDREVLEQYFEQNISPDIRGTVDWDIA